MKPSLELIEEMVEQATIIPIEYELAEENLDLKQRGFR